MNKIHHLLWKGFLLVFVSFLIIGCSKITQENFDKVQPNMSMQEVINILGEPTSSDSINIAGISGTSAVWQNKNAEINIQFLNNKVTIKVFNKPTNKKKEEILDTTT